MWCGRRDQGFSVIEALVVLVIVGIMLALTARGFDIINNRRLAGAARQVGSDMRLAVQRARAGRACWRIEFSPTPANSYRIQVLEGGTTTCTGGTWENFAPVPTTLDNPVKLVRTTFPGNRMVVSPFGDPTSGRGGTITLDTSSGQSRVITLNEEGTVVVN